MATLVISKESNSLPDCNGILIGIQQEAVRLKPTFADAYLNLGNVYKVSFLCVYFGSKLASAC